MLPWENMEGPLGRERCRGSVPGGDDINAKSWKGKEKRE